MIGKKHINDIRDGKALSHYLESKVGQPWDKVYSELCSLADHRSKVGMDLRKRIGWNIERDVFISEDGKPFTMGRYGPYPVRCLYVHPKTGLICIPPKTVKKVTPKKIEKVRWHDNFWFEVATFNTENNICGCRHFKFPKYDPTYDPTVYRYRPYHQEVAKCIHGNEPTPRDIWFVVEYGEHKLDEVYEVITFNECGYGMRYAYGLKNPGDIHVVHYRDVPNIDRKYIIHKKQANHKELQELKKLLLSK